MLGFEPDKHSHMNQFKTFTLYDFSFEAFLRNILQFNDRL